MMLDLGGRTNLFVNQSSLNYTFKNRKRPYRKRDIPKTIFHQNNVDEIISNTEHFNILKEYQEELKFLSLDKKNLESSDNSQTLKDSSTRDSDIVICVESNFPESEEKYEENEHFEIKKVKLQNNNHENIFNLLNLHNSIINKNHLNYNKITSLIESTKNESKKCNSDIFQNENNKFNFEGLKGIIEEENNSMKHMINKFYNFNINHSNVTKLVEKINNCLINKNNEESKLQNGNFKDQTIINNNKNKKDINFYSNLLIEKTNNDFKSCLSMTNDKNYFDSMINIANKISLNGDKIDNNLKKSIAKNKNILTEFNGKKKKSADNMI